MKLDKKTMRTIRMVEEQDDGFVQGTMQKRVDMVWDMTVALWGVSTRGQIHDKSRLQRDVAVLTRGAC